MKKYFATFEHDTPALAEAEVERETPLTVIINKNAEGKNIIGCVYGLGLIVRKDNTGRIKVFDFLGDALVWLYDRTDESVSAIDDKRQKSIEWRDTIAIIMQEQAPQ